MVLIESIGLLPVALLKPLRLLPFVKEITAHNKVIHLRSHETPVCIVRAAYDRLPPNVKARIYDHSESASVLETRGCRPIR